MTPLRYYLLGTGTWFASYGIQGVIFAWLITLVLRETPSMVGVAQTAMLLPAMLFMLIGGSLADRWGGRIVAARAQALAVIPPLVLVYVLLTDRLSIEIMIAYAAAIGVLQAFVTPARDSLLNTVASGRIQRTVVQVTLLQFTVQMLGFALAGTAAYIGGEWIVLTQALLLAVGAWALYRLPRIPQLAAQKPEFFISSMWHSISEGSRTVMRSPGMRTVVITNIAMGIFFMGSYIVTIPLHIREIYDGTSADLAIVNGLNSLGLVLVIFTLLKRGDIKRQGRALLIAHGLGAVFLGFASTVSQFPLFGLFLFCWGACGGVAMSMSRTVMQELAPEDQRGRVMGFFSFSFMGAGPVGALGLGFLVEQFGSSVTIAIAGIAMFAIAVFMSVWTPLWKLST